MKPMLHTVLVDEAYESGRDSRMFGDRETTLFDAIDSCVIWNAASLYLTALGRGSFQPVSSQPDVSYGGETSSWNPGAEVNLLVAIEVVARGVVFQVDAQDTCHGVPLGLSRISMEVKDIVRGLKPLPYPHNGTETIGEATNSFVLWDLVDIQSSSPTDRCSLSRGPSPVICDNRDQKNTHAHMLLISATGQTG